VRLYDIGYTAGFQFVNIVIQHTLVSAHDSINFVSFKNTGSHYGPYAGVHAWRIAAGSKHTDLADFFTHSKKIGCLVFQLAKSLRNSP
jgi:hypothetical protein